MKYALWVTRMSDKKLKTTQVTRLNRMVGPGRSILAGLLLAVLLSGNAVGLLTPPTLEMGSVWRTELVSLDANGGSLTKPGIAVAPDGTVFATWWNQNALYFADLHESVWIGTRVNESGRTPSVAIDADGNPHVMYGGAIMIPGITSTSISSTRGATGPVGTTKPLTPQATQAGTATLSSTALGASTWRILESAPNPSIMQSRTLPAGTLSSYEQEQVISTTLMSVLTGRRTSSSGPKAAHP